MGISGCGECVCVSGCMYSMRKIRELREEVNEHLGGGRAEKKCHSRGVG